MATRDEGDYNSPAKVEDSPSESANIAKPDAEPTSPPRKVSDSSPNDRKRKYSPCVSFDSAPPLSEGEEAPSDSKTEDPPLPNEEPPQEDDGWAPVWDEYNQAYYFYNRFTGVTQWENPRVPAAATSTSPPPPPGTDIAPKPNKPATKRTDSQSHLSSSSDTDLDRPPGTDSITSSSAPPLPSSDAPPLPAVPVAGGYNPAIHGDYDPNADYAIAAREAEEAEQRARESYEALAAGLPDPHANYHSDTSQYPPGTDPSSYVDPNDPSSYAQTGQFNRFTGRFQTAQLNPERFNDENKSKRQMNNFFDVDAAANSHDGRSLKAERRGKHLTKQEVKAFQQKRKQKKEEKRRAWLRD